MTGRPSDILRRGGANFDSPLRVELRDAARRRVREHMIAAETAWEVECPLCYAGIGQPCVTFPQGTEAQHTHMKRVNRRLVGVRAGLR